MRFADMVGYNIVKKEMKDGSIKYRCMVRHYENKKTSFQVSKTFQRKAIAKSWGSKQVLDFEKNDFRPPIKSNIDIRQLLSDYIDHKHIKLGRTKEYVLKLLMDCEIAKLGISKLEPHHLVEHCTQRIESGAGMSTVNHDISYLRSVYKMANTLWGYNINDDLFDKALPTLHHLNLIGKSNRRTRRPTGEEIELLIIGLRKREKHLTSKIPFVDILNFSILSCMRISEVCAILWADLDIENKSVIVRNRKDPRKKSGNHMVVPLLGGAFEIIENQEKNVGRIFPFNSRSVTAGFQRVRNELKIEDLRYHDLRLEGASRLFEKGYAIDEVAQVTGHRNINTLWQVYTELFPKRLHDKDV